MLLSRIHTHNRNCPEEEYIHILPVKNFNKFLQIDLVSLNYIEKPLYVQAFEEMAVRAIQKNYMAGDLVTLETTGKIKYNDSIDKKIQKVI